MALLARCFFLSTLLFCSTRKLTAFQPVTGGCRRQFLARGSSSAAAANGDTTLDTTSLVVAVGESFTSDPMKVFIEDTDAYGVVYNGNYLKFYDRALHATRQTGNTWGDDHVIVAVGNQKFKSSPALGDEYVIHGTLQALENERQIWDLSMKSLDGTTVYHVANGVVVASTTDKDWLETMDAFAESPHLMAVTDSFIAYRDEFDPSMRSHLPVTSVLNHFERPRSNLFGGPKELRRLQEEDGIVVVVSGIKDLCLLPHGKDSLVGDVLTVKSVYDLRKGGMRTDLYQTLYTSSGQRLAQGIVTLYTLNKETFRPTAKLPPRLLDRLQGGN